MLWGIENSSWILGAIGGALSAGLAGWSLRRLLRRSRGSLKSRSDAVASPKYAQSGRDESDAVVRRSQRAGWERRRDGQYRTRTSAGTRLKPIIPAAIGVLVVCATLYAIALHKGVSVISLPAPVVLAVVGPTASLGFIFLFIYLHSRRAMQRRAREAGVRVGPVVSSYEKSLVLSVDLERALAMSRNAILALDRGVEFHDHPRRPNEVIGLTSGSARCFGELIRVRIQGSPMGRAAVEVQSRPAVWQLYDGGVNAVNVREVARYLEARASPAHKQPAPNEGASPQEPKSEVFSVSDRLALGYLVSLALYTAFVIALNERWLDAYAAWDARLLANVIDPLSLLGAACPIEAPAAGRPIVQHLNILIIPTIVAYTAYNAVEFRNKRDRMDALNWMLCLGSLIFLPALVFTGCSPDWLDLSTTKYEGMFSFILTESAGAAIYALLLVIFTNGVSYLPALLLTRLFRSKP